MVHELEELYRNLKDKLHNYIMRLSGDKHVAEEIVQETFCRALEHLLISKQNLNAAWFYTVAKHLYFDYIKRQTKLAYDEEFNLQDESNSGDPDSKLLQNYEKTIVRKVWFKLKESYREILLLREFKELSYDEIARLTGMSMEQVKVTLYRARGKFKELYRKEQ